jgi:tetratricopeptide (TPR) repeat protein
MRLLSLRGDDDVAWKEFPQHAIPPYGILSHTWGTDEVSFSDLVDGLYRQKAGWRKIVFCGRQAARDGLGYFWVDTCCIDKWNKREREKAINSMFSWYKNAARCYVYLADVLVASAEEAGQRSSWEASFRASKWFTRGWTLQELIAPASVQFFSKQGQILGDKSTLEQLIHEVAQLPVAVLRGGSLDDFSTSERMQWAAGRHTTEPEDGAYCLVGLVGVLLHLTYGEGKEKAMVRLQEALVVTEVPCILPYSRNERFVGREPQLAEVQEILFGAKHTTRVVITGEGGTGKSQLALELAYRTRHARKMCSIFWIDASNMDSLSQSYSHIARRLDIAGWDDESADVQKQKLVHAYLGEPTAGEWQLILDNIDNIDVGFNGGFSLINSLPQTERGCIIFTTINKNVAEILAPEHTIKLGAISADSGQEMMRSYLDKPISPQDQQHVGTLLNELSFLPMAIVHAAAFINTEGVTVKEYRSLLRDKKRALAQSDQESNATPDPSIDDPVTATWLVTFKHLRDAHPAAADYLCFMGCITVKDIPLEVLAPPPNGSTEDAIQILNAYALVARRPADSAVDLHRLVHYAIQEWLKEHQLLDHWTQEAVARLDQIFPDDNHRNRHKWRRLLPHAQAVLSHILEDCQGVQIEHDEAAMSLIWKCAMALSSDGRWEEAESLQVKDLEICSRKLGDDHPDTLTSMANLASTYRNQGRWEEAEELEVQVMESSKTKLGDDHPDTLTSMANLASTYRNQGRWEEAEELEVQVMESSKTKLGDDHPDTLSSIANLAYTWKAQCRNNAAIKLMSDCVKRSVRKLGADHPDTLSSEQTLVDWQMGSLDIS